MGAGHQHGGHSHSHAAGANSRMLAIALALTTTFLVAELVGALVFNSLALLSDAAHMFTDTAALAIALAALKIGQRPADDFRTFGYRRFEILAAAFNAVLLFAVAGYVLWEGVGRFFDPAEVQSAGMLVVAGIGLVVNLISMRLLSAGKDSSLNVKGAYLEVWADMLGSVGVIAAAVSGILGLRKRQRWACIVLAQPAVSRTRAVGGSARPYRLVGRCRAFRHHAGPGRRGALCAWP